MKYRSNCIYVNRGVATEMTTPIDGLLYLLRQKDGEITIQIKVHRREQLYMYLNQMLLGVKAYEPRFRKFYTMNVNLDEYFNKIFEDFCVDKTIEYKEKMKKHKDKSVVSYHEITLKYTDIVSST